jgi:hypothetical protein
MIRGSVDSISNTMASGWIFTDTQKSPLEVEAILDQQIIGRTTANLLRPDIAAAGLGDGHCGFQLTFDREIEKLYIPFVHIRPSGTELELRRWGGAGFGEYFRELHAKYPRAGRPASVYGGLWTDRTDSASVLKGKSDIGQIGSRDANNIARYINDGTVLLARRTESKSPRQKADGAKTAELVAEAMFDEDMLRTLRQILEDHPVAVHAAHLEVDEPQFSQVSGIQVLPSPAECVGLIFPMGDQPTNVDVVRDSHRWPEFTADGLSRWTATWTRKPIAGLLPPDMVVDRYAVAPGSALLIGPGTLHRVRAGSGPGVRSIAVPARLSLLRYYDNAPQGELTHASGARIWI